MTNFCLGALLTISIVNTYLISDEIGGDNMQVKLFTNYYSSVERLNEEVNNYLMTKPDSVWRNEVKTELFGDIILVTVISK